MIEGAQSVNQVTPAGWDEAGLFRESFALASGPVTQEERQPDQCFWACGTLNKECDFTGQGIMQVYKRCNAAYAEMVEAGAAFEDLPDCALVEIRKKQSSGDEHA